MFWVFDGNRGRDATAEQVGPNGPTEHFSSMILYLFSNGAIRHLMPVSRDPQSHGWRSGGVTLIYKITSIVKVASKTGCEMSWNRNFNWTTSLCFFGRKRKPV